MLAPWPLNRHAAVFDAPREEAGARAEASARHRREDQLRDANDLSGSDAVSLVRSIRARALQNALPDSTVMIRADRDGR
ncbi:hypothetical protein SAMN05216360_103220 [Methylobacterium phyllostachyos]|uniref:Uncharacterized protein n=1 Tax=Methylobacterium phyllostachyos TaxID=582672 RepID=A0A1G9VKQ4_9HYPH|nr:hypothetical protein SAMN05216360_103220 [Methylobacterium phyllostachyos]